MIGGLMEKFYKSKEEMVKDVDDLRKEALIDIYNLKEQRRKETKKKVIKWSVIVIVFIVFFKCLIGTITISYLYPYNRLYSVTLNNVNVTLEVVEEKTVHIVPFLVNLKLYHHDTFFGDDLSTVVKIKQSEQYIINLESHKCFVVMQDVKTQLGCKNNSDTINELTNDTNYKLTISESEKNGEILYSGPFIYDITKYLEATGYYRIDIKGKYNSVESRISFEIKIEP